MTPDELRDYLVKRVDAEHLVGASVTHGDVTLTLDAPGYRQAAAVLRDDDRLDCAFFDCLFGIDARDEGFDVVAIVYSIEHRHRVVLKHRCSGGRAEPTAPTLTDLWRGADWHERETWDMFGIEFEGHPGLAPRLLTVENFEGWPLRKDFYLASRAAKPWPGVKEPAETDEHGNVIEKVPQIGDAPGPTVLDELMGEQARKANPRTQPALAPHEAEAVAEADTGDAPGSEGQVSPTAVTTSAQVKERADDATTRAKEKAERARQKAAEARARKAAERAAEGQPAEPAVSTPAQDTVDAPKDAQRAPEGQQGGPPGTPTEGTRDTEPIAPPDEGGSRPESPIEGGMHEAIDAERAEDGLPPDDRPAPEGGAPRDPEEDQP